MALGGVEITNRWISVGDLIVGAYLSARLTVYELKEQLLDIPRADNIIADFNCTNRYKRRVLLVTFTAQNLRECPTKGKTWRRWNNLQSRWLESKPDTVFSIGNWIMEDLE